MKRAALLLITVLATSLLTGCGKEEEIIEDVVEVINVEVEQTNVDGLPKTKKELLTMPLEDFKAMIEECIPNYRGHFKVKEDLVLTDEDWENFRIILSLELFGSAQLDESELKELASEETEEYTDPNAKYYDPNPDDISAMTDEEFVVYLSELQAYLYPDMEAADFSQLTPEQIAGVRESLISGLEDGTSDISLETETDNEATENTEGTKEGDTTEEASKEGQTESAETPETVSGIAETTAE